MTAPPPQKKRERRPSTPKQKDSKDNKDSTVKPEDVIVPLATRPPTIDVPDTGRKDGLPTCPIILIVGKLSPFFIVKIISLFIISFFKQDILTKGKQTAVRGVSYVSTV